MLHLKIKTLLKLLCSCHKLFWNQKVSHMYKLVIGLPVSVQTGIFKTSETTQFITREV